VGQARGGGARRECGGKALIFGLVRGTDDATPQVSRAHQAEISAKKWAESRQWAVNGASRKMYNMPSRQETGGVVVGISKRFSSRFFQLKTSHFLTGHYLHRTKNRLSARCRWCRCRTQTGDHQFKVDHEWKTDKRYNWQRCERGGGGGGGRGGRRRWSWVSWAGGGATAVPTRIFLHGIGRQLRKAL